MAFLPGSGLSQWMIHRCTIRWLILSIATLMLSLAEGRTQSDVANGKLVLAAPLEHQVFQRQTRGYGRVQFAGRIPAGALDKKVIPTIQIRWVGKSLGAGDAGSWQTVPLSDDTATFSGEIEVPAGGWYRIEVRALNQGGIIALGEVEDVGVGEVFVVAGQSNSANHGEEKQQTHTGMVSAFDGQGWRIAHDPQAGASGGGGSFLPPFGDAMAEHFQVPVGLVPLGIGATSVREWLPAGTALVCPPTIMSQVATNEAGQWQAKGAIYAGFTARMKQLGPNGFRAVLWHQGESDANQADPTRTLPGEYYRQYLEQLIRESRRSIGWEAPWFVALVSYHTPKDTASPEIRAAQKALWDAGLALPGPDSDALVGDLRDSHGAGIHFSGKGLREHARVWVEQVSPWLVRQLQPGEGRSK